MYPIFYVTGDRISSVAFLIVPNFFILWPWPWPLTYISKDFYIGHNFCTVRDIEFIFAIYTKVIKPF